MKRITKLIFAIGIFSFLFLISCHKKTTMVVVKFDNESYTIEAGTTISEPETPVRERFEFLGCIMTIQNLIFQPKLQPIWN